MGDGRKWARPAASPNNVGILSTGEVNKLSNSQPYSDWKGFRGIIHNYSLAVKMAKRASSAQFLSDASVTIEEGTIAVHPFALFIPFVRGVYLGYRLGEMRHAYLANRLDYSAHPLSLVKLLSGFSGVVLGSSENCRAYHCCVSVFLARPDISEQIKLLINKTDSDKCYAEFCKVLDNELKNQCEDCEKFESEIRESHERLGRHFNEGPTVEAILKNRNGALTDDSRKGGFRHDG